MDAEQEEARQICIEFLRAGPGAVYPSWGYDLNPQDSERVEKLVAALQAAQEREKGYLKTLARLRAHGEFVHDHVVMGLVAQREEKLRELTRGIKVPSPNRWQEIHDLFHPPAARTEEPSNSIDHPDSCLIHSGSNCTCGAEVGE